MLTHDDLKSLADVTGPCLTIYQPLRGDYSQGTKPEDRIASAIREAERLLEEKGFSPAELDEMLRPVLKIASNTDWTGRKGSLIMFRASGFTMTNFWPDALPQRVHFGQEFLVLPLFPALLSKRDFWLLALSTKAVRLLRGSQDGLVEVALPPGVATSLSEAGGFDQPDHSLRGRSFAGPSVGNMKGVQFGTSSAHEVKVDHMHDFFKVIDRGIHAILTEDPQPLILAGVTREVALYRKLTTYTPVLTGAVQGNLDAVSEDALYAKASELMSAYSAREAEPTLGEMEEAANRGLMVTDPAEVIEAARLGRVRQLIVSPGAPGFEQREETINWAVLATIRNSGKITVMNAPQPAMGTGLGAIVRFRPAGQNADGSPQLTEAEMALNS